MSTAAHFGVTLGTGAEMPLQLTREGYEQVSAAPTLTPYLDYSDEWIVQHRAAAMRNFDLNMRHFAGLDQGEFEAALLEVLAENETLQQVDTLRALAGVAGLYLLVLDGYRQIYVGQTTSRGGIQRRIRDHWTKHKNLDRQIFGTEWTSILSVDSFGALDTTRIFARRCASPRELERPMIASIPAQFRLNREGGDQDRFSV